MQDAAREGVTTPGGSESVNFRPGWPITVPGRDTRAGVSASPFPSSAEAGYLQVRRSLEPKEKSTNRVTPLSRPAELHRGAALTLRYF